MEYSEPVASSWKAWRLPDSLRFSPLVLALLAIMLLAVAPPVIFLINASLHETLPDGAPGAFTLRYYEQLVSGRFFVPSLVNTLIYACGSSVIAIFIGTVQALIVERTNSPGRKLAFLAAIISLGVPHILYTVAWLLLLGRSGPVNDLISSLFNTTQALDVYSLWGMMLIEGVGFVPLTFLLMSAVLRSTDASFEEAAMMSGAGPLRAFASVTLRMALPALAGLTLLIFVKAFESFEVPALVGLAGNVNVFQGRDLQRAQCRQLCGFQVQHLACGQFFDLRSGQAGQLRCRQLRQLIRCQSVNLVQGQSSDLTGL